MLNRNQLALFRAVAEAGSFSRAAVAVHVSQPAISMQVGELEENLGLRLFERLPRGVRLTGAGADLLEYVRRIGRLEEEAERTLAEWKGLRRGRLAVGASQTIGVYLLPEILGEFRRRHPGVEIALEVANTESIQNRLRDRTLDVGLTEGALPEARPDLQATVFGEDELVAIAPPGHPLIEARKLSARRLCGEPLILREAGSGTREVFERALARRGLAPQRVTMVLGSTEAIKRAVAAGLGLAVVSRLALDLELSAARLAVLPVGDLPLRRPLHLLQAQGRPLTAASQAFIDLLQTTRRPLRA